MSARIRQLVALAAILFAASGCEWFTDFKRQPSIWTWEQVKDSTTPSRGNPQFSVPVTGIAVAGFQVSYAPLPGTVDSLSGLANPTAASDSSLGNGRKYYQINCSVCHGDAGAGDGPATKYGMPGISIVTDVTRGRSDGYIFGMMRNGRGLMPSYNRIEDLDRWDVVNYLRALQGSAGRAIATGPLAAPGVTGDKLPGYTRTAPTRPAPFMDSRNRVIGGALPSPAPRASAMADTVSRAAVDSAVDSAAAAPPAAAATDSAGRRR